jgi:hypothetical protein
MLRNADVEKTQDVPPRHIREAMDREMREKDRYADYVESGTVRAMTDSEILAELFRYHPPTIENLPKFAAINQAAKNFAEILLQNCPPCADRSAAIRLIRDARMTANAAVALNGLSL